MNCHVCEFLKDAVKDALRAGLEAVEYEELRRLAFSHYRRFHPNPFDIAMSEVNFMNP